MFTSVTFNHVVEGSSPSALTKQNQYLIASSEKLRICPCGHCVGKPVTARFCGKLTGELSSRNRAP